MVEEFNANTDAYIATLVPPSYLVGGVGNTLSSPTDMVFNSSTDLFISSQGSGNVLEYDANTGAFVGVYTTTPIIDPEGLAFDSTGNLYVADGTSNVVRKFAPGGGAGAVFEGAANGISGPRGIAVDASNNVYVVNSTADTITRYLPSGANDGVAAGSPLVVNGVPGFKDPTTNVVQTDNNSGDVYVAWTTDDTFLPNGFTNPNNIRIVASDNGGTTFTDPTFLNTTDGGYGGAGSNNKDYSPALVVSGFSNGVETTGGTLTAVWDNNSNGAIGTAAAVSDTQDNIMVNSIIDGGDATVVSSSPRGVIRQGINATPPPNDFITTTPFTIQVNPGNFGPNFTSLSNINVTVSINSPNESLSAMALVLKTPGGQFITLMSNGVDNVTGAVINPAQGVSGSTLGQTTSGTFIGTTFDDAASRVITGVASPVGRFIPEEGIGVNSGGGLIGGTVTLSSLVGSAPGTLTGQWTLEVLNYGNYGTTNPPSTLNTWSINFTSGLNPGTPVVAATTALHGNLYQPGVAGSTYTAEDHRHAQPHRLRAAPGDRRGPDHSAHSARTRRYMYIAYVNHEVPTDATVNPTNNTDIDLAVFNGTKWTTHIASNVFAPDYSIGALFDPSVAVDQTTGTVLVSYYDTRHGTRPRIVFRWNSNRAASTAAPASAPAAFLNDANVVFNEALSADVTIGPIPDNDSAANPVQEKTFAFGTHESLAVFDGQARAVWSESNLNGGDSSANGNNSVNLLRTSPSPTPRSANVPRHRQATSGPVGPTSSDPNGLNQTTSPTNGAPVASALIIQFDRPVLATSVVASEFTIQARDANGNLLAARSPSSTPSPPLDLEHARGQRGH